MLEHSPYVKVHNCTNRERLNEGDLFGKAERGTVLGFAKLHLQKQKDFWNKILLTDNTKADTFLFLTLIIRFGEDQTTATYQT